MHELYEIASVTDNAICHSLFAIRHSFLVIYLLKFSFSFFFFCQLLQDKVLIEVESLLETTLFFQHSWA